MRKEHYTAVDLIRAAARDGNKKRPYLLVDPLQGKHIPVSPSRALGLFERLADEVNVAILGRAKELGKSEKEIRTFVIAFAETATAIGAGLAAKLKGDVKVIQTTRENVTGATYLYFSESHSHATEQRLVADGLAEEILKADLIVFAEDEVTTGNTIRHLIEELQQIVEVSTEHFAIASLLNGMLSEKKAEFKREGIQLFYLVGSDNESYARSLEEYRLDGELLDCDADRQNDIPKHKELIIPGAVDMRRITDVVTYQRHIKRLSDRIIEGLEQEICGNKKREQEILVLGTEEFMYPAMCVGAEIERKMDSVHVFFHATSRSPILTSSEDEYPLHRRNKLISMYDDERVTYVYDLRRYDKVIVITDAMSEGRGIDSLARALIAAGNTDIQFVRWAPFVESSYSTEQVKFLLSDITGKVRPLPSKEREVLIQSGRHYSEMLPVEYVPTEAYMEAYRDAMDKYGSLTAQAVEVLAEKIIKEKGEKVVLVSLARAGVPVGILLKDAIKNIYDVEVEHYAISIIRDRGIDSAAMDYLLSRYPKESLQFVDGWIGKGAITTELKKALSDYPGVSTELAVVADPAHITRLYGTQEDILIPSSCLNSTVSGLVSRTFLREDIIRPGEFHGAAYYGELSDRDLSQEFISQIEARFSKERDLEYTGSDIESQEMNTGLDEVHQIMSDLGIDNVNFVKPGIGEATRVLLRRVPWKVLIAEEDIDNPMLEHLKRLALEKRVPIERYPLKNYKACGIIKKVADL